MDLLLFYTENLNSDVQEISLTKDVIYEIKENDLVSIILRSKEELTFKSLLWLTELAYNLNLIAKDSEGYYIYDIANNLSANSFRSRIVNIKLFNQQIIPVKLVNVFQNTFGKCEILFQRDSDFASLDKVGDLNILSSKISKNELDSIFDFLYLKDVSYWKPLALVESKEFPELKDHHVYLWLLKQIEDIFKNIYGMGHYFKNDPYLKIASIEAIEKFSDDVDLTDSSLIWLFDNLSNISRTNIPTDKSIKIKNRHYEINEILTDKLLDITDNYENSIIHGFFHDVIDFLYYRKSIIVAQLDKFKRINDIDDSYVSLASYQKAKFYERVLYNTKQVINLCEKVKFYFQEAIPVKFPIIEFPVHDQAFFHKDHYLSVLKYIKDWFNTDRNPVWGDLKIFAGTKSLDELFELFCLFKFIDVLEKMGFDLINRPSKKITDLNGERIDNVGIYNFKSHNDIDLTLYYNKLPNDLDTIISTSLGSLKPDIVLEYKFRNSKSSSYAIFDAKYRKASSIDRHTYQEVIPKYLHGLAKVNGTESGIDFLFLLHPPEFNTKPIGSYHIAKRDIMSDNPIIPSIGRIQISFLAEYSQELLQVLNRIFQLSFNKKSFD